MKEMKDSGVEWIDKVPSNWELTKAKNIFNQRNERGNANEVLLSATQMYGMIPQEQLEGVVQTKEETDLQTFKTVHINDYVISLRSFQGGFEASDYEGVCSPAYQVFYNTKKINHKYFRYLFKSDGFIEKMNSLTVGIREGKNIQYKDFAQSIIPYPPYVEQLKIADYLDLKCAQIDSIISKQEAIIEKLKEYKLSVITEAVTKGLNPDVEMKDSGYDFIGMVPKHWAICRLRNIGKTQNGISKGGEFFGKGTPFVSYGDVYRNYEIPENIDGLIEVTTREKEQYSVEEGDIFFTRTSETIEEIGFSSVCMKTIQDATFAGFLIRVRPFNKELEKEFAKYYFRSSHQRLYFAKEMNLVTRASLGQDLLKSMPILLPPREEQIRISQYLEDTTEKIDAIIQARETMIVRFEEYKKTLIYEVVTGKKEV